MSNIPDFDKYIPENSELGVGGKREKGVVRRVGEMSEKYLNSGAVRQIFLKQSLLLMTVSVGVPYLAMMSRSYLVELTDPDDKLTLFIVNALALLFVAFGVLFAAAGLFGMFYTAKKIRYGDRASFGDLFTFFEKRRLERCSFFAAVAAAFSLASAFAVSEMVRGTRYIMEIAFAYYGDAGYYSIALCFAPILILSAALLFCVCVLILWVFPIFAAHPDEKISNVLREYFSLVSKNKKTLIRFGYVGIIMAALSLLPVGTLFPIFFVPRYVMDREIAAELLLPPPDGKEIAND